MSTFQLEDNLALLGVIPRTYALVLVPLALYLVYKVRTSIFKSFPIPSDLTLNMTVDTGNRHSPYQRITRDPRGSSRLWPSIEAR
jgi:hypothetical protein